MKILLAVASLWLLLAPAGAWAQSQTPITDSASAAPGYVLGPGDKLRIAVFGEEELSGEYAVGAAGEVTFPLIGEISALGSGPEQLARAIEERLRQGYLRNPRVSVAVTGYRPFYILGEVQNPGTYAYSAEMTIMSAVATAGGFTYRANRRRVYIRRGAESDERAYPLDSALQVQPGDTVRIGERLF